MRGEVLLDLGDPAGAGDHRRDPRIGSAPGDRQLGEGAPEFVGDRLQVADDGVLRRLRQRVAQPLVAFEAGAAVGRNPVEVLAGERARGQRAPGGQPEADVVVESGVLLLDLAPIEQVVLGLLHTGLWRWWRSAIS